MPRHSRTLSKSSTYHIMIRGNERKALFIDDEDRIFLLDTFINKKEGNSFALYAYCLMDNHVHMVIKEGKDSISRIMKRINTSYAYYFNNKYKRVGHVFQDRYKSETVDSDEYLLAAVRYVHNNPVKAGIVKSGGQFKWSSFNTYTGKDMSPKEIVDKDDVLEMFSSDRSQAVKMFVDYSRECDNDFFMDIEDNNEMEIDENNIQDFIKQFLIIKGKSDQ